MVAIATQGSDTQGTQGAGRRIAQAAVILLSGFVASRLVGLLRDVVVYGQFGATGESDVYFAAFRIPDLVFNLVAGGALGSALVPVFAEYRAGRTPAVATRLAANVFNAVGLIAAIGALLGIVFAPVLAPFLGPGFSPEQQALLTTLVRILLLQPVLFGLGEVVTRYLNVQGHFLYPAVAPTLYNLCIIGAALLLGPSLGIVGLAGGVVVGALVYLLVQLPAARAVGFRWAPVLDTGDPGLRRIVPLMVPRLIDRGAVQVGFFLTTRLASFLPDGRFAALNLGWTLMMLPLGTVAMSTANAAFPVLSEQAARGERRLMTATVRRTLSSVLFLLVPAAIGLILAGLPLVQTVFVRGQFTNQSAIWTAVALGIYAVGLPAHGSIEVLVRSFYALQDTRTPVTLSVLAMVLNVALAAIFLAPFGYAAIAGAMTLSASLEALALFVFLARRLDGLAGRQLAGSAGRTLLAGAVSVCATVPVLLASRRLLGLAPPLELVLVSAACGLSYAGAALLLRSPELMDLLGLVRRRLRRS